MPYLTESTADFSRRTDRGSMLTPIGDLSFAGITIPTWWFVAAAASFGISMLLKRRR